MHLWLGSRTKISPLANQYCMVFEVFSTLARLTWSLEHVKSFMDQPRSDRFSRIGATSTGRLGCRHFQVILRTSRGSGSYQWFGWEIRMLLSLARQFYGESNTVKTNLGAENWSLAARTISKQFMAVRWVAGEGDGFRNRVYRLSHAGCCKQIRNMGAVSREILVC